LSLTLVALALVTLPLLLAVGNAVFKLDELMDESLTVAQASEVASREGQRARRAIDNMLRIAQQYLALGRDEVRLELYQGYSEDLAASIENLTAAPHPERIDAAIATISTMIADIETRLTDPDATEQAIVADLGEMSAATNALAASMNELIAERLAGLEAETGAAQRMLAWQAAALIPGTLILILFFILLVGRPIRQIDRAIRELGKGDFGHPITVSGPTDLETLGRQLEWLRLRLAESSEEKNKFLRHMSHELKTPLANIREGTELLLDGSVGSLDHQQKEVTGILRENSVKLQRLIENLLTFSAWQAKTASLELTQFELKPLVFATLSQHRLVISNRGIKLELDVAPIGVRADEGKLRLVLENLISNAIKFTPAKGTIAIRANIEGSDLVVEVADSGPGIATEDRGRIFEAFYQGRRLQGGPVGGTGIGLSVVHECVQAHGGSIELKAENESRSGGAHFVVRLPLRRADDRPQLVVANG
jgi:two-component system sensor histidine kinase GlrK